MSSSGLFTRLIQACATPHCLVQYKKVTLQHYFRRYCVQTSCLVKCCHSLSHIIKNTISRRENFPSPLIRVIYQQRSNGILIFMSLPITQWFEPPFTRKLTQKVEIGALQRKISRFCDLLLYCPVNFSLLNYFQPCENAGRVNSNAQMDNASGAHPSFATGQMIATINRMKLNAVVSTIMIPRVLVGTYTSRVHILYHPLDPSLNMELLGNGMVWSYYNLLQEVVIRSKISRHGGS